MTRHDASGTDSGQLLSRAQELAAARRLFGHELRSIIDQLRQRALTSGDAAAAQDFLDGVSLLSADQLTHPDVTAMTREYGLGTIPQADSFWRSVLGRRRKKQIGNVPEKYLGISKERDERFAKGAGVEVAETLYRGSFSGLPRSVVPSVVKPVRSSDSLGAFYVFEDHLFSIAESVAVPDWDGFVALASQQLGAQVDQVEWELQIMVRRGREPAHDLKFYCFYGVIGAVLEISRYPCRRYAYFDGELAPIELRTNTMPCFADLTETNVLRGSVTQARLDMVRKLSLEIPAPFMRIDFLDSEEALIFVEFSSAPGRSDALHPDQDQRLGEMYHAAEMRVVNDLLDGKSFEAFHEFCG